jgi:hypothetical protein
MQEWEDKMENVIRMVENGGQELLAE